VSGTVAAGTFSGSGSGLTGTASSLTAGNANELIGKNWYWSGQSGQPSWLWGGSDGTNMYVYNPSNFSVNSANYLNTSGLYYQGGNVGIGGATATALSCTKLSVGAGTPIECGDAIYASSTKPGAFGMEVVGYNGGVYASGGSTGYGVNGAGTVGVEGWGTTSYGVYGQGPVGVFAYGTTYDFQGLHGEYTSGSSWVNGSSRDLKTDFTPVDDQAILSGIASLPITKWVYKTDTGAWHIGPIAEDFYSTFNLGDNNKSISTIDPSGIALVGIKALDENMSSQQTEITAQQAQIDTQQTQITELQAQNATLQKEVGELLLRK